LKSYFILPTAAEAIYSQVNKNVLIFTFCM